MAWHGIAFNFISFSFSPCQFSLSVGFVVCRCVFSVLFFVLLFFIRVGLDLSAHESISYCHEVFNLFAFIAVVLWVAQKSRQLFGIIIIVQNACVQYFSYYLVNSSQIDDGLNKSPRHKRAKVVEVSWQRKVINYCIRFSTHKFGSCFTRKSYSHTRFWVVAALKFNFQFQIACYCNGSYLFFTQTHTLILALSRSLNRLVHSFVRSICLSLSLSLI